MTTRIRDTVIDTKWFRAINRITPITPQERGTACAAAGELLQVAEGTPDDRLSEMLEDENMAFIFYLSVMIERYEMLLCEIGQDEISPPTEQ